MTGTTLPPEPVKGCGLLAPKDGPHPDFTQSRLP